MGIEIEPRKEWIRVCAWCGPSTWPKLLPNQEYTHGMCKPHNQEYMASLKKIA